MLHDLLYFVMDASSGASQRLCPQQVVSRASSRLNSSPSLSQCFDAEKCYSVALLDLFLKGISALG